MGRVRIALLIALLAPAVAIVPFASAAERDAKDAKDAKKSEKYDPENVTAISQYVETIAKGTERFSAKDVTGAIDAYKKAIPLSPKNPLAHYMLAEAYLVNANLPEAEAAIAAAYEGETKNAMLRGHVLFLRAEIAERQKKADQAKAAWQAYAEHAAKNGDAGAFPQSSAERLKAIQRVAELDKAYAAVRERIAAEKAATKADAGKPPAKK